MASQKKELTIVLNVFGLQLSIVSRGPMDLHSHQWVHNGTFFAIGHFGELLPTNDLEEKNQIM